MIALLKLLKLLKLPTVVIQSFTASCKIIEKIFAKILDKGVLLVLYLWLEFHNYLFTTECNAVLAYLHNHLIIISLYEYNYASRCSG